MGITRLSIDPSNEQLFLRRSHAYQLYQRFLTIFGSDETILVALHDSSQSLLTPAGLTAVQALTQALAELPHVASVTSLTNAQDITRLAMTPFGITAPGLITGDELSDAQRASIRHNDLVIGTLLSADLHTAGFLVVPKNTIAAPRARQEWLAAIRAVVTQHATRGRQTYVAGTPLERHDVTAYLQRDQQRIIPLVFLILLSVTYSIYRVKRLALIPLACVLLALLWTMGIVGFSGIALNLVTSLLPPVIMVVSVSVAIHLLNQYIESRAAGAHSAAAVEYAIQQVSTACLLTSLTTAMGFFSLLVSPVPAVQEFALFAGVGVFLAFIVTMTVVPLALLHVGQLSPERLLPRKQWQTTRLFDWLPRWISANRYRVLVGALLILALLLPGIGRLSEGTDIIRALKQHAPLRVSSEFIDRHLSGVNSLEIMVQLADAQQTTRAAVIRQVLAFSAWLRAQAGVSAVYSPWELLRAMNPETPAGDEKLSVLATLLPLAVPLEKWLNTNTHTLRISARVLAMSSHQFLELAQQVEQQAQHVHLSVQVTGSNYLLAQMSRSLVQTQIRSLLLAAVLILGCITLCLGSWELGLLAAIPNVLPPLMIFGLMGWCGITLSTATVMIASVALGLIVDNTIHLLYHYRHAKRNGRETLPAVAQAMRHTGRALIFTTLILTLGFWAGMLGSFKPTISFSFLTGLTMVVALLADLLVLPATILVWERRGRQAARRTSA